MTDERYTTEQIGAEPAENVGEGVGPKRFSDLRDGFVGDFLRTNRDITTADRARWKAEREERKSRGERERAPWTKREIWMVSGCVLLAVLIVLRYFVWKI